MTTRANALAAPGTGPHRRLGRTFRWYAAAVAVACVPGGAPGYAQEVAKVSAPGRYEGYSPILYRGYSRSSVYVPARDGTRLAVDIYRPTSGGKVVDTRLPVIWMQTPYNRRGDPPAAQDYAGNALDLVKYGYVVATADFRGVFASFGKSRGYNRGEWAKDAWFDGYDVTEWLAKQPWSSGKVGMWGCSATGGAAMHTAITAPPSLKAVFDISSEFDAYIQAAPGGLAPPVGQTFLPDLTQPATDAVIKGVGAAPVDGPDGARLLAEAIASHEGSVLGQGNVPFRDSRSDEMQMDRLWVEASPYSHLDVLRKSRLPIYAVASWNERWIKHGSFYYTANLPQQTKLLVGPYEHCRWNKVRTEQGFDIVTEELRFFDYWLKGVKNGVMDEPRVTYFTYNAPSGSAWQTAAKWPLPQEKRTRLYLGDHALSAEPESPGLDVRVVDYTTSAADNLGAKTIDEKGALYASAPLAEDMQVTGHPTMNLWMSATATDADVIATLEDLSPDGTVTSYQMYGSLRASRRALAKPPYDNLGLPWHSHLQADAKPLIVDQPVELQFDLLPMSYIFKKGHRIRLVLTFSDPIRTPRFDPAPSITIYRDHNHPSYLTLPIVPAGQS